MIMNLIEKISNMSSWYLKSAYDIGIIFLEKAATDKE